MEPFRANAVVSAGDADFRDLLPLVPPGRPDDREVTRPARAGPGGDTGCDERLAALGERRRTE